MGLDDDRAEDARIDAFTAKVAAQKTKMMSDKGNAFQQAQDRRVLDAMRLNETQAKFIRSLSRDAGDPLDIEGEKAAE